MNAYSQFNEWLASKITAAVSTMTCAYLFAALACVSLPEAIRGGPATLIAWIAQTFLQLVLLSVIMVGQKIQQNGLDGLHEKHDAHAKSLDALHESHKQLHRKLSTKTQKRKIP